MLGWLMRRGAASSIEDRRAAFKDGHGLLQRTQMAVSINWGSMLRVSLKQEPYTIWGSISGPLNLETPI